MNREKIKKSKKMKTVHNSMEHYFKKMEKSEISELLVKYIKKLVIVRM